MEVNIDYIKMLMSKLCIKDNMNIETESKIKETLENYGLQESMLDAVKMILAIQNLLTV